MESYRPDRDLSREDMGCNLWHISDLENLDGTRDMWRAYTDMRDANWIGADKYFHARGIYDANRRGPGGVWAAEVLRGSLQSGQVRLELFGKRQMRKHCLVLRLFQCRCLDEEDSFVFALRDEFR